MSDDRTRQSGRQPAEGVRIIKAEEAQAALDAGEAAGRRPDDQLRFGDVPPAPTGPRPAHRFPLPDSVNPADAVALPPLRSEAGRRHEPGRRSAAEPAGPPPELDQPVAAAEPDQEPATIEQPVVAAIPPEAAEPAPPPAAPRPLASSEPAAPPAGASRTASEPTPPPAAPSEPALPPAPSRPLVSDEAAPPPAVSRPAASEPAPPRASFPRPSAPQASEPAAPWASDPAAPRAAQRAPSRTSGPTPPAAPRPVGSDPTVSISAPSAGAQPPTAGAQPPPPPPRAAAPRPPERPSPREREQEVEADAPPWAAADSWQPSGDDRTTEMGVTHGGIPEEGINVSSGASPEMPHWSDPPTGEVPRLRFADERSAAAQDDMEAWRALGRRGVRWRDEDDWDDADELSDLVSDDPMGALDQTRAEHSDLYSFDEDFERVRSNRTGSHPVVDLTDEEGDAAEFGDDEDWAAAHSAKSRAGRRGRGGVGARRRGRGPSAPPAGAVAGTAGAAGAAAAAAAATEPRRRHAVGSAAATERKERAPRSEPAPRPPRAPRGPAAPRAGGGSDLASRVAVGIGLIVLLAICYAIGPKALVALSTLVVVASAAEAYNMTRAPGFRPATLLGLVATVGCVLGAYWRGIGAISVVTVLLFAGAMLWYVLGVVEARPLANVAVTVMVFVWVSVLGSFSAVLLAEPQGKGLFLGAILVAVAADVCAFAVGRWIGSRPIAPRISPHKTVEGFIGGIVGALIVGAVVGKVLHPWSGMRYGLVVGLVVGLIAPAGDLFESMLKRDLGIKDSGSILGGHGGLLDRFDGILLALPAAYFVTTIAHIH